MNIWAYIRYKYVGILYLRIQPQFSLYGYLNRHHIIFYIKYNIVSLTFVKILKWMKYVCPETNISGRIVFFFFSFSHFYYHLFFFIIIIICISFIIICYLYSSISILTFHSMIFSFIIFEAFHTYNLRKFFHEWKYKMLYKIFNISVYIYLCIVFYFHHIISIEILYFVF